MTHQDDAVYISQTLSGDTRAYGVLVDRYQHMVYTLACRMLSNDDEAQEVAQDVFVKAYQKLATFKGDAKFSTWLYRITYNKCLDALSRKRRYPQTLALENIAVATNESASAALEAVELKTQLTNCIQQLKPTDAFIITLFYLEEQSLDEIAVAINTTANNAKVKLFRARKKLYEIMATQLPKEIREVYERT